MRYTARDIKILAELRDLTGIGSSADVVRLALRRLLDSYRKEPK